MEVDQPTRADDTTLRSFLVSGSTSMTVVDRDDVGRSLVATQDFPSVGVEIFREKPLLVWHDDDSGSSNFLGRFLQAPLDVQSLVLDMYTPPEDGSYMMERRAIADALSQRHEILASMGPRKISKLIGVHDINAHEFPNELDADNNSALFAYGSKLAHSCWPNASYISKAKDGCLEYKTIRPIQKGELITFPYFRNQPSKPTFQRRLELMDSFGFYCQCPLCRGPDYARIHGCRQCDGQGRVTCRQPHATSKVIWTCTHCGDLDKGQVFELEQQEQEIQDKLDDLRQQRETSVKSVTPSSVAGLVLESTKSLSNTHYLTLQCLLECHRTCVAHVRELGDDDGLYQLSAKMRLQYIRACECVAARCLNSDCKDCNHPPIFSCNNSALQAFEDLQQITGGPWPEGVVETLQRYVPILYLCFGVDDMDVQEMDKGLSVR